MVCGSDNKAELAFHRFSREPGLIAGAADFYGRSVASCVYSGGRPNVVLARLVFA